METMSRLDEIAERAEKATPERWEAGIYQMTPTAFWSRGNGTFPIASFHGHPSRGEPLDNCVFACHARSDIPWLVTNARNALAFIDKILAGDHSSQQLMYLRRIERILTGLDDGHPANDTGETK
jgi:hypothetical protein